MASGADYDDSVAHEQYLEKYWSWYMTDFEQLCSYLGRRREKADASENKQFVARVDAEWEATATSEVQAALSDGLHELHQRIKQRIVDALRSGKLSAKRCPSCHRIVATPKSQQCLWCGHDWHRP